MGGAKGTQAGEGSSVDAVAEEVAGPCPMCGAVNTLLPFQALPCRHVFCYYCIRSNTEADIGFKCPLDGVRVQGMRGWPGRRVAARGPGKAGG